jgi:hypothetical protein
VGEMEITFACLWTECIERNYEDAVVGKDSRSSDSVGTVE